MRLIRFGDIGNEKPGILNKEGQRIDLSSAFTDWDSSFFNDNGLDKLQNVVQGPDSFPTVDASVRWASCVPRPGKVVCIGLNYSDHAQEAGMAIPKEPIVFQKGSNTVVGPNDPIIIPKNSTKTDWEVELGIVIGKDTRYLNSIDAAEDFIAGYCISNDVSEREFQLEKGGQWTKGKSCDNFNPIGPSMATTDEISDPQNLKMKLWVNGELMQNGNSSTMIFDCKFIVYYLSQYMTLEAGDVISTGTPPGVAMGMENPQFLKVGDVVEVEIEGLGKQRQVCVEWNWR